MAPNAGAALDTPNESEVVAPNAGALVAAPKLVLAPNAGVAAPKAGVAPNAGVVPVAVPKAGAVVAGVPNNPVD